MSFNDNIPRAIIKRLPLYRQSLAKLRELGKTSVSSKELSKLVGVEATIIRKDLAFFGELGKRGVGYNVELLYRTVGRVLNIEHHWDVALVGSGKMASALVEYNALYGQNFRIAGVFGLEPVSEGEAVEHLPLKPLSELAKFVHDHDVKLGILATPPAGSQKAADALVSAGVKAILSFAPVDVEVPADVKVLNNILIVEIQILACCLSSGHNK